MVIIMLVMKMKQPIRRLNRLANYDYGQEGCYFVTLCTQNRANLFEMEISVGNGLCAVSHIPNQIIHKWIVETQNKFGNIEFEKYVVMPDHLHFIVKIKEQHEGCSLQDVMRYFKTMTTNEFIRCVKTGLLPPFDRKVWQKSYYDHIIRNQQDYNDVWEYIENNPAKWLEIHGVNA